ncbi:MAG TPA: Si-specific NAD(P)(+) transhydrogenase [Opitutales bacterium]|jgi:NAD(P) transhydrogenase|nr:Si-specific NAD(P)(+) transhydrogenase [Opitutales bacterium]
MKPSYDLVVIGSGPAGEKAAALAAFYGHSVAIVEKEPRLGGAGTNTGTLPSKTLKETAVFLSGFNDRGLFGVERRPDRAVSVQDLLFRKNTVTSTQADDIRERLKVLGVDIFQGLAALGDAQTVNVQPPNNAASFALKCEFILVATGSRPWHIPGVPFDGVHVHDSDTILEIDHIPESIVIVGAGVIGCEYATVFAALGSKVSLVNGRPDFLTFIDSEILTVLRQQMEREGVNFIMPNRVDGVTVCERDGKKVVTAHLSDGAEIQADMFLYAAGRVGNIDALNLAAVGLKASDRQTIEVDEQYRTAVKNIFAVGDIIGFPALASTGMDQGRVAVTHMFNLSEFQKLDQVFPMGVYTIPEVSCAGLTEEDAKKKNRPYLAGRAWYKDTPRGRIIGAKYGMMKILADPDTLAIIGVHIIGRIATELIHYGLLLVEDQVPATRVAAMIYNQPTLHELYKHAAFDIVRQKQGLPPMTGASAF